MRYIKDENKKDVNIEITGLTNIIEKIKNETKGKRNIEVMLYSYYYNKDDIVNYINSEWTKEFYNYLTENNIKLSDIITVLPKEEVHFQDKKEFAIK